MIPIVVSGAGGQLGKAFVERMSFQEGYSVYSFDKRQLDISDQDKVRGVLATLPQVKYWINCAAYTKVDEAEKFPGIAHQYNTLAPGYIATACKEAGVHLIHFSSDYVYHNVLRRPLLETDPTEPKGIYAISKLKGEQAIQETHVRHTIIRTSWVYGPGGQNFVNTMLRLGKSNQELRIVCDQTGAPTFTFDIVDAVKSLIQRNEKHTDQRISGIFNFANQGEVSWDNFARTIFKQAALDTRVISISTAEYGAAAARPEYSVLDCSKISGVLDYQIPDWQDALGRYLRLIL
jgi:dTDP-4-dehydrorhamnose reductase